MEIDFALINEVNDFKEDYYQDYLNIINEASKQLEITDDLELSCILVDDQKIHETVSYTHLDVYKRQIWERIL